jgi:hypothetical protein
MSKFLKIEASTTGTVLIGLDNIGLVAKASDTTVTIAYTAASASTDIVTITHTTNATFATVQAIIDAIIAINKPNSAPLQFITPTLPSGISVTTVAIA